MYGVVWITPPKNPASTDATPSVKSTLRVSYSSPAAWALSVQSRPPTIVAKANGNIMGILASAALSTRPHHEPSPASAGRSGGGDQAGNSLEAGGGTRATLKARPRACKIRYAAMPTTIAA